MQRTLLLAAVLAISGGAKAAALSEADVPEPLAPWIGWVLHGEERARCPFLYDAGSSRACVWGGPLRLQADDGQGRFRQRVRVYAPAWVELPGGAGAWPNPVRVNGEPAPVAAREGRPALWLEPGDYGVSGDIPWRRLPRHLPLPAHAGLVELELRGAAVAFPDRDAGNRLWFSRPDAPPPTQQAGDALELDVFRRLVDEVPFQAITRLELSVSGDARELLLGPALLEGYTAFALDSKLPARLEADGRLRLQVRPGRWTLSLAARRNSPVDRLELAPIEEPWPDQEVWVFDARNALRVVELGGLQQVDPRQTRLPARWHALPAYLARPGQALEIATRRRGDPEPEPDQLRLSRSLWLDFDGGGYTFSDRIEGKVTRSWRLNASDALALGRVVVDGRPQFITREGGHEGVEIRQGRLNLVAEGRMQAGTDIPATGWRQDLERVAAILNLPPGWRLLTATGADGVSRSWIGDWTLFDLFLVLVIAAAVGRLWGWRWALVALLGLGLAWHEANAPRQVWLHVIAAAALLRVLPSGRIQTAAGIYRYLALLALVILVVPYAVQQLRLAVYPQLEFPHRSVSAPAQPRAVGTARVPAAPAAEEPLLERDKEGARLADLMSRSEAAKVAGAPPPAPRAAGPAPLPDMDPDARVQTGPGLPRWQWRQVSLTWNGPVAASERVGLLLVGPGVLLALRILAVLLVGALAIRLLLPARRPSVPPPAAAAAAAVALLVGIAGLAPRDARAEFPDPELLEALRARLLQPPDCLPVCAQSPLLELDGNAQSLRLRLFVHAFAEVAVPLPGGREHWLPREILIDDIPAEETALREDGVLWLRLSPGRHAILMEGPVPPVDRVTLALGLAPKQVIERLQGWQLSGVKEDGTPEAQLQLERVAREREAAAVAVKPVALPPLLRVERTLELGLEWRVSSRVLRLSPPGAAVAVAVPVLEGESVTSEDVQVEDGRVRISMAPEVREVRWESVLARADTVTLEAPPDSAWTEHWRLQASPIWHVGLEGIPVVHHQSAGHWLPQWRPWPGEQVTIRITRPEGVPGRNLTLEASRLELAPGSRAAEGVLSLELRASQGLRHTLTLPEAVELQGVTLDGRAEPVRAEGRNLTLPLTPGIHRARIVWRQTEPMSAVFRTPELSLGADSVNAGIRVAVPRDRWVVYAGGPRLGPAVLFWSVLLVVVVVAVGLSRTGRTPLGLVQWLLLGVGLSQVPVWLALPVVGWLFALDTRGRLDDAAALGKWRFNLMQVGLALLTLVALGILFYAVQQGLLGRPDMQIAGNGSSASSLRWFEDRIGADMPRAWMLSAPMWVYRLLMLGWALWLAFALIGWLRWGFGCFATGGIWRAVVLGRPKRREAVETPE